MEFCDAKESASIVDKRAVVVFPNLAPGAYAFYLHHDENDDSRMNSNIIGMPTEGYAFSNGARPGILGLPTFASSRVEISGTGRSVDAAIVY
jgi:uncharacterized protein (DUF2141 family)